MAEVIYDDVEFFLTGFLRRELGARPEPFCRDVFVSNDFSESIRDRAVIVRHDGGPDTGIVTAQAAVGITVLARDKSVASDLARMVAALVRGCARHEQDNPVTAVLNLNGPFRVTDDTGLQRRYLTLTLGLAGRELN